MEIERWVSSKEVAKHLGVNKDTLQRWINNKSIPCHRVGRLWKFRISEIDVWVQSGGAANADKNEEE
jgi:excisionase family DNA binding protein